MKKINTPHIKAAAQRINQKGFSLIELMIVIAILAVLGTAIYVFFANITTKSTVERSVASTQQKARLTVEMMARDIRLMGLDPTGGAGAGLIAAAADSLSFSADLNYDGDTGDSYERITYSIINNELVMTTNIGEGATVENNIAFTILTNVNDGDLTFRYFNRNMNAIAPANVVWNPNDNTNGLYFVEISLIARTPTMEDEVERTYSTTVRLRNVRSSSN